MKRRIQVGASLPLILLLPYSRERVAYSGAPKTSYAAINVAAFPALPVNARAHVLGLCGPLHGVISQACGCSIIVTYGYLREALRIMVRRRASYCGARRHKNERAVMPVNWPS